MKIKNNNKGKVYPSPSSSSSSSSNGDYLSVLKLLPAAILALSSVLPLEDREVLAYLITWSIKTTTSSSSSSSITQKKSSKKSTATAAHKPPVFDCECFDCYTSYWFRWDSSPNRELIHQAIEAFEDHLASGESEKSKKNAKSKRRDRTARRLSEAPPLVPAPTQQVEDSEDADAVIVNEVLPQNDIVAPVSSPSPPGTEFAWVENGKVPKVAGEPNPTEEEEEEEEETMALVRTTETAAHKGLARKVLPDVLGLLNSRLWSLWSPNV